MILDVKLPILGFENIHKIEFTKIDDNFASIKNIEDNGVPAFTLVNPYSLREYSFDVPTVARTLLEIGETSNMLVYCIMVLQNPLEQSLVNFLAPIVINTDTNTIGQIALDEGKYPELGMSERLQQFIAKD